MRNLLNGEKRRRIPVEGRAPESGYFQGPRYIYRPNNDKSSLEWREKKTGKSEHLSSRYDLHLERIDEDAQNDQQLQRSCSSGHVVEQFRPSSRTWFKQLSRCTLCFQLQILDPISEVFYSQQASANHL